MRHLPQEIPKLGGQTFAYPAEDPPSQLASQHQLAAIFWVLGRRDTPLLMMRHMVKIRSQAPDKHHPNRINSEAWLKHSEDEMRNVEAI